MGTFLTTGSLSLALIRNILSHVSIAGVTSCNWTWTLRRWRSSGHSLTASSRSQLRYIIQTQIHWTPCDHVAVGLLQINSFCFIKLHVEQLDRRKLCLWDLQWQPTQACGGSNPASSIRCVLDQDSVELPTALSRQMLSSWICVSPTVAAFYGSLTIKYNDSN